MEPSWGLSIVLLVLLVGGMGSHLSSLSPRLGLAAVKCGSVVGPPLDHGGVTLLDDYPRGFVSQRLEFPSPGLGRCQPPGLAALHQLSADQASARRGLNPAGSTLASACPDLTKG